MVNHGLAAKLASDLRKFTSSLSAGLRALSPMFFFFNENLLFCSLIEFFLVHLSWQVLCMFNLTTQSKVRFPMIYSSRKLNNKKVITTACNFWRQIACSFQVYGRTNHHNFCAKLKSTRKALFWISRFFSPDQHWRHNLFLPTIFPTALRR